MSRAVPRRQPGGAAGQRESLGKGRSRRSEWFVCSSELEIEEWAGCLREHREDSGKEKGRNEYRHGPRHVLAPIVRLEGRAKKERGSGHERHFAGRVKLGSEKS